jgi:hypothetical protein
MRVAFLSQSLQPSTVHLTQSGCVTGKLSNLNGSELNQAPVHISCLNLYGQPASFSRFECIEIPRALTGTDDILQLMIDSTSYAFAIGLSTTQNHRKSAFSTGYIMLSVSHEKSLRSDVAGPCPRQWRSRCTTRWRVPHHVPLACSQCGNAQCEIRSMHCATVCFFLSFFGQV